MRKPTSKVKTKTPNKDKFTATEVGSLIEHFRGEFKLFGERQDSMANKLDATYEQVGKNTEKIALLEIAIKNTATKEAIKDMATKADLAAAVKDMLTKADLANVAKEMATKLELANVEIKLSAKIEALTNSIDKLIKTKADREDILSLEKRVGILETKVASLSR